MTVRILPWHSAGEHRSSFIDSEGSAAPSLLFPVVTISRHLDGGLRTGQAYVIFPPKIFPTRLLTAKGVVYWVGLFCNPFSCKMSQAMGSLPWVPLHLQLPLAVQGTLSCLASHPTHQILRETVQIKQNHSCTQAGIPGYVLPAFLTISYCPLRPLSPEQENLLKKWCWTFSRTTSVSVNREKGFLSSSTSSNDREFLFPCRR